MVLWLLFSCGAEDLLALLAQLSDVGRVVHELLV